MKQTSSLTWRLNRRHTAPDVWRSGVCSIVDVLLRHEGDNVFEEYPYEIISIFPKGLTSQYDDLSTSDALVLVSVPYAMIPNRALTDNDFCAAQN